MTIGEKIRQARKHCGLSQEQLAEKLCVSRSAVAKWETEKGMPDIENLKQLSRILGVTLDQLLQEEGSLAIREPVDLAAWGRGCKKVKKDRIIRAKFPDAVIHTLLGQLTPTRAEKVMDNVLGFLTEAPFGIPEFINSVKNLDKEFYLVEQGENQYFVTVTDLYLESRTLEEKITASRFSLGDWSFIKCNYPVE